MDNNKKSEKKEEIQLEDLQEQVEELESKDEKQQEESGEIELLKKRITDLEAQVKRTLADYQNLERRSLTERKEWIKSGNKDLLLRLLPVLDILMLAARHIQDKGLDLSIQQFLNTLSSEGVIQIKTAGEVFDPYTMECVEIVEGEDNAVIEELRPGFKLHDRILRSAQVKVGKAK